MSWSECCGCVMAFSAACQRHMMVLLCCVRGITNKLLCRYFLPSQEANDVFHVYGFNRGHWKAQDYLSSIDGPNG